MAYALKPGQITEEERRAIQEKPFQNGSSYDYVNNEDDDNGYQDAYNELVRRIRHTRVMYEEQMKGLKMREDELDTKSRENKKRLRIMIVISLTLVILYGLRGKIDKIMVQGKGASALTIMLEIIIPVTLICIVFILLPLFVVQQIKYRKTRRLLSGKGLAAVAAKEKGIVTFADERTFLKNRIADIDDYMDQLAFMQMENDTETLRKQMDLTNVLRQQGIWQESDMVKDAAVEKSYTGVLKAEPAQKFGEERWTENQRDVIAKMRSLSLFREYHANGFTEMVEMHYGWMLICSITIAGALLYLHYGL